MANVLAFDFGGTYVKYGLVNTEGQVLEKDFIDTPSSLDCLLDCIKGLVRRYTDSDSLGIAISSPGAVTENGLIQGASSIPYIHGPNIKEMIERETGMRTAIENDANCAGLAEVWKGAAVGEKDVATVVIGTGIGGALIKDGIIHKGHALHGGEFGYMVLNPQNLGGGMNTFSEVASTYSIVKRVAAEKKIDPAMLTGKEIFALAEIGDEICQRAISEFVTMLAIGVFNIQYAYDPALILIGGGISQRADLIPRLRVEIDRIVSAIDVAKVTPQVERCAFHADANLVGAVYHFLQSTS